MGAVKKIVNAVNKTIFGKDSDGDAQAIRDAAERQARAQEEAANKAAETARQAAAQQAEQARNSAAAAVSAQTAQINQAAQAAQLQSQIEAQPKEPAAPDVNLSSDDGSDPRRKYRGGSGSIGGTEGGVGIRI